MTALPCPTCSLETEVEDFCGHSTDPLCARCCGAGEHATYCPPGGAA